MVSPTQQDPTSPRAIAAATFPTVRRGYHPTEVGSYLRSVATEMARLRERISQLQTQLSKARAKAAEPEELDEATMLRLLGEETSRVLATARASANDIKARAEVIAAKVLRDAHDEGNTIRNEADIDAARIREQAHADGRVTIERAREEARAMAIEVREYRERVLADLNRRTALAKEQIGELLDGRDRLLQVFERARLVAIDVTSGVKDLDLPTEYVNLTPTTGPVPVMVKSEDPDPTQDDVVVPEVIPPILPAAKQPELDPAESNTAESNTAESEPVETMTETVVETAPDPAGDTIDESVAEPDVADVADPGDAAAVETVAADATATIDDNNDEGESSAEAPSDDVDLDIVVVDTLVDESGDDDEPTNVVPFQRRQSDELSDELEFDDIELDDIDELDDLDELDDQLDDELEVDFEPAAETLTSDSTPDSTSDSTSDSTGDAATDDRVGGLFARLRESETETESESESEIEAETGDDGAPVTASVDAAGVFELRAKHAVDVADGAARKLKRVLADEQNEVLQVLRTGAADSVDDLLPPPQLHAAAYLDAIADEVDSTSAAAAVAFGAPKTPDVTDAVRTRLIADLIDPLRHRLDRAVRDNGGDNEAIAKSVRAVYREWKRQHIDIELAELLRVAFATAASAAIPAGVHVVWTPDPDAVACAECEDNSLAGEVPNGHPFPTGHTAAPAHGGCRCLPIPS